MANILGIKIGSKFPKTEKYETKYQHLRNDFNKFHTLEKSDTITRFFELDTLVHSGDFEKKVLKLKRERFKDTEAYKKYRKFREYKRSSNVKQYNKFVRKNKVEEAEVLKNSHEIQTYLALKKYVESEEFAAVKIEMNDKNHFKKTKEYQLQEEYKTLSKSEDVIWFLKTKKKKSFHELDKWNLTFEDDFNSTKLDESKWITGYYWGKALLNDNYVQDNEKQFFKQENVELRDSCVRIISKNETCKGKVWNSELGFVPREFDFTSGLISTGQSFRQQFGRFEAKIKFNHTYPAAHTFWLLAEQIAPQINIIKTPEQCKNKIEVGHFWANDMHLLQKTQKLKIPGSSDQFYIYTLEWSKNKLIWKINGVPVFTQTENIPQEPMYISLSTHFTDVPSSEKLPISMDVDWVRCYQIN